MNCQDSAPPLFWFELQLDESHSLSNSPTAKQPLHWRQGPQFLPEARVSSACQPSIVAKHDGSGLTFESKKETLPKEAFSSTPRFDSRHWRDHRAAICCNLFRERGPAASAINDRLQ